MIAAIAYADQHGLDDLALRTLGAALGATGSAIYRYFSDKDDLISTMREELLGEVIESVEGIEGPRDRLVALATAFRSAARTHPCLSQLMVRAATSGINTASVLTIIVQSLEEMGLRGHNLVLGQRQLESFVVGSTLFDLSGAPIHLEQRAERFRLLNNPAFEEYLDSPEAVEAVNEQAYLTSLNLLIDSFTRVMPTA